MIYVQMHKPTLFRGRKLIASLFYPWQLKSHIKVIHTTYRYMRTGTLLVTKYQSCKYQYNHYLYITRIFTDQKVRWELQKGSFNLVQTIDNVHSMFNNGIRRFFGNLLNINTSLLTAHQYWSLQFIKKQFFVTSRILRVKVQCRTTFNVLLKKFRLHVLS